jgi:hypothetical protein
MQGWLENTPARAKNLELSNGPRGRAEAMTAVPAGPGREI